MGIEGLDMAGAIRLASLSGGSESPITRDMSFISAAMWRRVIPAGAVAAVLAASYLTAPLASEANGAGGFGYNCGVKGYGYHDHGKACPNRPFPGQGEGLAKFGGSTTSSGNELSATAPQGNSTTSSVESDKVVASQGVTVTPSGSGHGHSQIHSRGRGN